MRLRTALLLATIGKPRVAHGPKLVRIDIENGQVTRVYPLRSATDP